jgi:hypothetical protein
MASWQKKVQGLRKQNKKLRATIKDNYKKIDKMLKFLKSLKSIMG